MADKSGIEWTDATWNPLQGCSKVSEGCKNCYAETLSARYSGTGNPGWPEEFRPWTPANAEFNVRLRPERLDQPLRWQRSRRVFVNSMSDLFHELVPELFIRTCFSIMAAAKQHQFQVLTKRPERMRDIVTDTTYVAGLNLVPAGAWGKNANLIPVAAISKSNPPDLRVTNIETGQKVGGGLPIAEWKNRWPNDIPPNVWLGTSIENNRWVHRADALRDTPAAVRFISAEPLLGPLDALDLTGIDWVIVGGESAGPEKRALVTKGEPTIHLYPDGKFHKGPRYEPKPEALEWVRDIRDRCNEAGVKFLFKQWGGPTPKSGGRELDGRTWDEYPA